MSARALSLLAAVALLAPARASAETLSDFPCKLCSTYFPSDPTRPTNAESPSNQGPRPLLVVLHGDNGGVHFKKLFEAWKRAADPAGVVVLALRCPLELGCKTSSWWQWYASPSHDPAWVGAQIDAVRARASSSSTSGPSIDDARVYATGYSGGATYLGYYVPANPTRFAAVAYVSGGLPYARTCPVCKYPVLFVIGNGDPMIAPYTGPLRQYYEACGGHELEWQGLRGVSHEGMLDELGRGRAATTLAWLLARPARCMPPDAGAGDAGAVVDAGEAFDAGAATGEPSGAPLPAPSSPRDTPSVPAVPTRSGCACRATAREEAPFVLPLTAFALAALFRRRREGRRSTNLRR